MALPIEQIKDQVTKNLIALLQSLSTVRIGRILQNNNSVIEDGHNCQQCQKPITFSILCSHIICVHVKTSRLVQISKIKNYHFFKYKVSYKFWDVRIFTLFHVLVLLNVYNVIEHR